MAKKETKKEKKSGESQGILEGRILVSEAFQKKSGEKVKLAGWAHEIRALGKINFLILRDISGRIQTVAFKGETPEDALGMISKINRESAIVLEGTLKDAKQAPGGKEIGIEKIEILNSAEEVLPNFLPVPTNCNDR